MTCQRGGNVGSGPRQRHQVFPSVLAAKMLGRPARVTMTRRQILGHARRPTAVQRMSLGAGTTGKPSSIRHGATPSTSRTEDKMENADTRGLINHACPNADADETAAAAETATSAGLRTRRGAWRKAQRVHRGKGV